jgi:8-oxo-dGTP diphosphatase
MTGRPRACAAILRDGQILMVLHIHDGCQYWMLPGGGVEPGETYEQAARREVLEECGLAVRIICPLFERDYVAGREYTFLAEIIGDEQFIMGNDSEHSLENQWIQDVCWHSLKSVKDDRQVKLVIQALNSENFGTSNQ